MSSNDTQTQAPDWRDLDAPTGSAELASAAKQIADGHAVAQDFADVFADDEYRRLVDFTVESHLRPVSVRQLRMMRHAVGITTENSRDRWGVRNSISVLFESCEWDAMLDLGRRGLARRGVCTDGGLFQYFHLTPAGCRYIGLDDAAIRHACGGDA